MILNIAKVKLVGIHNPARKMVEDRRGARGGMAVCEALRLQSKMHVCSKPGVHPDLVML